MAPFRHAALVSVVEMFGLQHDAVTAEDSDELCRHMLHPRLAERSCFVTLEPAEDHRLGLFYFQGPESVLFMGDKSR